MPLSHRRYADWTVERIRREATSEQGFRACLGIVRLVWPFGADRLEAAATRAIEIGTLTYGSVRSILDNKLDRQPPAPIDDRGFRAVALRLLSDMRLDLIAVFGRKWDQNCEAARLTKDQSVLWQCPSWGHPVDLEKVWWRLAETRCLRSGRR